jgi:hypothetical protein
MDNDVRDPQSQPEMKPFAVKAIFMAEKRSEQIQGRKS